MLDFREKKKIRKTMYSSPVLVLLLILLVTVSKGTWDLFQNHEEALRKTDEAQAELSKLEAQERELKKQVAFLQTDRGREEQIRGKFMVEKPGENVIMVVDPKESTTTEMQAPTTKPTLWSRFLELF